MEKNGVIETRTERRTVITRDGDNIDHDKVGLSRSLYHFTLSAIFHLSAILSNLKRQHL